MKQLIAILALCLCTTALTAQQNTSYDVIINLDDRLTNYKQQDRDIRLITRAFNDWKTGVQKQLYITSESSFRILITDQTSTGYEVKEIAQSLTLNLSNEKPGYRRTAVDNYSSKLQGRLAALYQAADRGSDQNLYSGANLWKYLNGAYYDEIRREAGVHTHMILLTDGYIDFESAPTQFSNSEQFSSTAFLQDIRVLEWEEQLNKKGLLPCSIDLTGVHVSIYELSPKVDFPFELQILKKIHTNWFKAMGAEHVITKGQTASIDYVAFK
jgi:hypothetical protein